MDKTVKRRAFSGFKWHGRGGVGGLDYSMDVGWKALVLQNDSITNGVSEGFLYLREQPPKPLKPKHPNNTLLILSKLCTGE